MSLHVRHDHTHTHRLHSAPLLHPRQHHKSKSHMQNWCHVSTGGRAVTNSDSAAALRCTSAFDLAVYSDLEEFRKMQLMTTAKGDIAKSLRRPTGLSRPQVWQTLHYRTVLYFDLFTMLFATCFGLRSAIIRDVVRKQDVLCDTRHRPLGTATAYCC
jgi:hypothetical protein